MQINIPDIPAEVQQAKSRLGIVGNAPALIAAISRAIRVAPINLSVLVIGQSGTGKEYFPQIIHQFSPRKHGRYIAVNCGAIPEGTIDSELFGHEKGAFTGAVASRKGYFEEADGGTIFLDEVAELPLTTQARLLRVLESGEFMKVGSSTVQRTNIRVVAATNVDLARAVNEKRFREDLYYRLSTVQINVPSLCDRGNDILLLARKFATDFADRYQMPPVEFDETARQLMLHYRWPGNVRQLKNAVEQLAVFEAGNVVGEEQLLEYVPLLGQSYTPAYSGTGAKHDYEKEREMLFNLIFRLQQELGDLRQIVEERDAQPRADAAVPRATFISHAEEVAHMDPTQSLVKFTPTATPLFPGHPAIPSERSAEEEYQEAVPTLEETERETIRRSLERNSGRRKATAAELRISERTLYRKIKEYGLE